MSVTTVSLLLSDGYRRGGSELLAAVSFSGDMPALAATQLLDDLDGGLQRAAQLAHERNRTMSVEMRVTAYA